MLENHQRACISIGLKDILLQPEDIVLLSDFDEIPGTDIVANLTSKNDLKELAFIQSLYFYSLHFKVNDNWKGSIALTFEKLVDSYEGNPQLARENRLKIQPTIKGGWHFPYFGNVDFIINKLKNFAHQELNKPKYLDREYLQKCLEDDSNLFFGASFVRTELSEHSYLPNNYQMLLEILEQ